MPRFTCDSGRSAFNRCARKKSSSERSKAARCSVASSPSGTSANAGTASTRTARTGSHSRWTPMRTPLLRRERLERRGRPQPHQRVRVAGRLLAARAATRARGAAGRSDTAVPRTIPGCFGSRITSRRSGSAARLEGAARVEGERVVRLLLLPAGVPPPHRLRRPLRRAIAVAVVAGVRGVLPAERDGEVRPWRAERVVVPRVDTHVRLGPQVAGHAGRALPVLPVEVVLAAWRSARAGGRTSRPRRPRP